MLTKLQIAFCVVAGLGIVVFGAGMVSNINVAKVPGWLGLVAWGSVGLVLASCAGVVVTIALDRERPPADEEEEEESELLPVDEPLPPGDETVPDLTTTEQTEIATEPAVPGEMEFTEPASEETIEFSTLPTDE